MSFCILAHALPLGPEDKRDFLWPHCFIQSLTRVARQANAPESRVCNFLKSAGEIDDTTPWHHFKRT